MISHDNSLHSLHPLICDIDPEFTKDVHSHTAKNMIWEVHKTAIKAIRLVAPGDAERLREDALECFTGAVMARCYAESKNC